MTISLFGSSNHSLTLISALQIGNLKMNNKTIIDLVVDGGTCRRLFEFASMSTPLTSNQVFCESRRFFSTQSIGSRSTFTHDSGPCSNKQCEFSARNDQPALNFTIIMSIIGRSASRLLGFLLNIISSISSAWAIIPSCHQ
jgi:hypothetical protein